MKRIIGIPWTKINKAKQERQKEKDKQDAEKSSNAASNPNGSLNQQAELTKPVTPPPTTLPTPAPPPLPSNPIPIPVGAVKTRSPFFRRPKPPKPGLTDIIANADTRAEGLDGKIAQCNDELKKIQIQIRRLPEGSTKITLRSKAQLILQRRKKFELQADQMRQQSFNFEQVKLTVDTTKEAKEMVNVMQTTVKQLKKEQKKVNVEKIEDLNDALGELLEESAEVQEALATDLNMPAIDDEELEEQLELLGQDFMADTDSSYLDAVNDPSSAMTSGLVPQTPSLIPGLSGDPTQLGITIPGGGQMNNESSLEPNNSVAYAETRNDTNL